MASKIRRLKIGVTLTVVLSLIIVLLSLPFSGTKVIRQIRAGGAPLPVSNFSAVPQSVVEDATRLATELFEDSREKSEDFVKQLLATYLEAKDKDFIIFFNSGGWGWTSPEASPEWQRIFTGIQSELNGSGYTSLLLGHQRTTASLRGHIDEIVEMITLYPSKAKDLARRVEFLTNHVPGLKVIIAGESNGTVISDRAMNILEGNPQVYSIQTGPPFWHKSIMLDRTLVLTSNGIVPDSFGQGDLLTMFSSNLETLFGFSQREDDSGKILRYIGAPGHSYRWQYPEVYSQITSFLDKNFGIKWR